MIVVLDVVLYPVLGIVQIHGRVIQSRVRLWACFDAAPKRRRFFLGHLNVMVVHYRQKIIVTLLIFFMRFLLLYHRCFWLFSFGSRLKLESRTDDCLILFFLHNRLNNFFFNFLLTLFRSNLSNLLLMLASLKGPDLLQLPNSVLNIRNTKLAIEIVTPRPLSLVDRHVQNVCLLLLGRCRLIEMKRAR